MELIKFLKKQDFGHELYIFIIPTKKFNTLYFSFSFNDYPSPPSITINLLGPHSLFEFFILVWRIGFDVQFITYYQMIDLC